MNPHCHLYQKLKEDVARGEDLQHLTTHNVGLGMPDELHVFQSGDFSSWLHSGRLEAYKSIIRVSRAMPHDDITGSCNFWPTKKIFSDKLCHFLYNVREVIHYPIQATTSMYNRKMVNLTQ
mmetsp:Transcript_55518/g.118251  ORF Transcript_55518/g.118251 Transcript_55518/m.118251 type:complete len:121 (+) Transcript_55518:1039-1401(+)